MWSVIEKTGRVISNLGNMKEIWQASLEAVRRLTSVRLELAVRELGYDEKIAAAKPPSWWYKIRSLKDAQDWRAVELLGTEFPVESLNTPAREVYYTWLGNASAINGKYPQALQQFRDGLDICKYDPVRCDLLSNIAYLYAHFADFAAAEEYIREALALDNRYRPSVYNALVIPAIKEDQTAAKQAAEALVALFPDAGDPTSQFGREILKDQDLAWFRTTRAFAEVFPALDEWRRQSVMRAVSDKAAMKKNGKKEGKSRGKGTRGLGLVFATLLLGTSTQSAVAGLSSHARTQRPPVDWTHTTVTAPLDTNAIK